MTEMRDLDDSIRSKVYLTLCQLITNDGIKNYFNSWNENDNNQNIIDVIFNKIILAKFMNQYHNIITYKSKHMDQKYYQNLLFNIKDLMCVIFEFLNYDNELINCSLVCSHWLYYVYNTPLFNINNFTQLILTTIKYDVKNNDHDTSGLRMWHRLTKLKSIDFDLDYFASAPNQLLLDKLSNLNFENVETIKGSCWAKHVAVMQSILKDCKDNIKYYSFKMHSDDKIMLSPLILPNATHVSVRCLCPYIIWSDKCQELELCNVETIDKEWCEFVINRCDCSNIKSLAFSWEFNFDFYDCLVFNIRKYAEQTQDEKKQGKKLFKKLAKQFINLHKLKIDAGLQINEVILLFCKYLKNIIDKNNVKVELEGGTMHTEASECDKIITWIKQVNIANQIRKLSLGLGDTTDDGALEAIKRMVMFTWPNVEWITFTNKEKIHASKVVDSIVDCMTQVSFESLKAFEYKGDKSTIQTSNKILEMVMDKTKKSKFYVIAQFEIDYHKKKKIFHLFDAFYQNIFDLMQDQIPIDITLTTRNVPDRSKHDEHLSACLSPINTKFTRISKGYKSPRCNKYCVPLDIPTKRYTWYDARKWSEFVAKAASSKRIR